MTKEIEWNPRWFEKQSHVPIGYWVDPENRRKFLDDMARDLNITSPKQWGNVSYRQLKFRKGDGVLYHHGNNIFRALKELYPGSEIGNDVII